MAEDKVDDRQYYQFSRPEIEELVPGSAKAVLDIGCGEGLLSRSLKANIGCRVTGIELEPTSAAEARLHLDEVHGQDALEVLRGLASQSFDTCIAADILEHLVDPWTALAEVHRLLVADGTLIVSLPNVRHWTVLVNLIQGRWPYEPAGILDKTHLRFFVFSSMVEMLNRAAFAIETVKTTAFNSLDVDRLNHLVGALGSIGMDVSTLAEEANVYQYIFKCGLSK